MTQQSSMMPASRGRVSLISMPLCPLRTKLSGDGMKPVPLVFFRSSPVGCCPSTFLSAGLGSKVSICEGPPFKKRKMTRWGRGEWWGRVAAEAAGRLWDSNNPASPNMPNPQDMRWSISRRDMRGHGGYAGLDSEFFIFESLPFCWELGWLRVESLYLEL